MSQVVITITDQPDGTFQFKADYGEAGFDRFSRAHLAGMELTRHMNTLGEQVPPDAPKSDA